MNVFNQLIRNVQGSTALVQSRKGNTYPVIISDKVRLSGVQIREGDTGVIHRVNGRYYLYDVIPKASESDSSLSKVLLEDMGYDY